MITLGESELEPILLKFINDEGVTLWESHTREYLSRLNILVTINTSSKTK